MAMARLKTLCSLFLHLMLIAQAHYNDDSDYDFLFYDHFSMGYEQKMRAKEPNYEDFYILAEIEEPKVSGDFAEEKSNFVNVIEHEEGSYEAKDSKENWLERYLTPEKAYRYTKHRIPGYDYEELDYLGARSFRRCDDKSVWTHCLCQFTCANPDEVDCYTPCKSGCECKESYVFDEHTQRCLPPEECPSRSIKDNLVRSK